MTLKIWTCGSSPGRVLAPVERAFADTSPGMCALSGVLDAAMTKGHFQFLPHLLCGCLIYNLGRAFGVVIPGFTPDLVTSRDVTKTTRRYQKRAGHFFRRQAHSFLRFKSSYVSVFLSCLAFGRALSLCLAFDHPRVGRHDTSIPRGHAYFW